MALDTGLVQAFAGLYRFNQTDDGWAVLPDECESCGAVATLPNKVWPWECDICAIKAAEKALIKLLKATAGLEYVWVAKMTVPDGASAERIVGRIRRREDTGCGRFCVVYHNDSHLLYVFAAKELSGKLEPNEYKRVPVGNVLTIIAMQVFALPGLDLHAVFFGYDSIWY